MPALPSSSVRYAIGTVSAPGAPERTALVAAVWPEDSSHRAAAVHGDDLTVDPRGIVGQQERDSRRYVRWLAEPGTSNRLQLCVDPFLSMLNTASRGDDQPR